MKKLTKRDIGIYLVKINLNFENAYNFGDDEQSLLVESWYEALSEYPKEICDRAVNNALKYARFAPKLGDIVEGIEKLMNADSKSDEELWAELMDVTTKVYDISRYLKYEQYFKNATAKLRDIYDGLSGELKLYVVNISTLIEISELPRESLPYEKARFFKQMPVLRRHAEEKQTAKKLLESISEVKKLPDNK